MPPPEPSAEKQLIEALYNELTQKGLGTEVAAQLIQSISFDSLSGEKYISELLQNADDAGATNVEWVVRGEYLIFKHNGKPFDEKDIKAICNAAAPERDKVEDVSQIGNKGIGFKAVFTVALKVYIFSGAYRFCFDEQHAPWKADLAKHPWQITPIWVEQPEQELDSLAQFIEAGKICFIFKLRPSISHEITPQLKKIMGQHLLFLRHVKHMQITLPDDQPRALSISEGEQICRQEPTDPFSIVQKKIDEKSAWLVYTKGIDIPAVLRTTMSTADKIPPKYMKADKISLQIALLSGDGKLLPLENGQRVFCYLPTDIDLGLGAYVLVNADFLLDTSRMSLREGREADAWNQFIMENLWRELISFLSALSIRSEFWPYVFNVLTNPADRSKNWGKLEKFRPSCVTAFKEAIKTNHLAIDLKNSAAYTISSIQLDLAQFIELCGNEELRERCINPKVENQELIRELGGKPFGIQDIRSAVGQSWFLQTMKDPQQSEKFLGCLMTLYAGIIASEQAAIVTMLKESELILSSRGVLKKLNDICLPNPALQDLTDGLSFLDIIHPVLNASEGICAWLGGLGIGPLSFKKVVDMANKNEEEIVKFTIDLIKSGKWKQFDEATMEQLKRLKVKTQDGTFTSLHDCYLSQEYHPRQSVEQFVDPCSFLLSLEYSEGVEGCSADTCREFFIKLGIGDSIEAKHLGKLVPFVNESSTVEKRIRFTQFVFKQFIFLSEDQRRCQLIINDLATLQFCTKEGKIAQISTCFLGNAYRPQNPLEDRAPQLPYIDEAYLGGCSDEKTVREWRQFLSSLGANDGLKTAIYSDKNREQLIDEHPESQTYFTYLEHDYGKDKLMPGRTRDYIAQHTISFYMHIPSAERIYTLPLFWQTLANEWAKINPAIRQVKYVVWRNSTTVASNLHYLVNKAIAALYANKKPAELYACAMRQGLERYAEHIEVAEVTKPLTLEQASVFGFNTKLSVEHCRAILCKIAEANDPGKDITVILFVYQQLLQHIEDRTVEKRELEGIKLLQHANSFAVATTLHYITDDFLNLTEPNKLIIRKPQSLSTEEFILLCDLLGVSRIDPEAVTVMVGSSRDSQLKQTVDGRLKYIVNLELDREDLTGEQKRQAAVKIIAKTRIELGKLKFYAGQDLQIKFKDVFSQPVDLWLNEADGSIYHAEPLTDLGYSDQKRLYEFLYRSLGLKIDKDEFVSLMSSSLTKIEKTYKNKPGWISIEESKIDEAAGSAVAVSSVPHLPDSSMKRPSPPEDGVPERETKSEDDSHKMDITGGLSADIGSNGFGVSQPLTASSTRLDGITEMPSKVSLVDFSQQSFASTSPAPVSAGIDGVKAKAAAAPETKRSRAMSTESSSAELVKRFGHIAQMSKEQREVLGQKGEQKVYEHLRKKHLEKYGKASVKDTEDGYLIEREGYKKEVKWLNKQKEAFKHYDFEIIVTKPGQMPKTRYIEVKATQHMSGEIEINYSLGEWEKLHKATDGEYGYKLYVVANLSLDDDSIKPTLRRVPMDELCKAKATDYKRVTISMGSIVDHADDDLQPPPSKRVASTSTGDVPTAADDSSRAEEPRAPQPTLPQSPAGSF